MAACKFRDARITCVLTVEACAKLLRVDERTIRNWESGSARIPYAAFKLMRVLRGGKVLGPEWPDFFIRGDTLFTPEGHRFRAGDMAWWSLLVRRAREFSLAMREISQLRFVIAEMRARERAQANGGEADGIAALALAPRVDSVLEQVVASSASTSRPERGAADGDPLPGSLGDTPARTDGQSASRASDGQRPGLNRPKSLKSKRNPPGSLSLTLPVRPEITKQPRKRQSPAVAI